MALVSAQIYAVRVDKELKDIIFSKLTRTIDEYNNEKLTKVQRIQLKAVLDIMFYYFTILSLLVVNILFTLCDPSQN